MALKPHASADICQKPEFSLGSQTLRVASGGCLEAD